jgi:hypothetical protein
MHDGGHGQEPTWDDRANVPDEGGSRVSDRHSRRARRPEGDGANRRGGSGRLQAIVEAAKSHGLIAHRFYGSGGKLMVIDEWPDAESFQRFFAEQESTIGPIMQQVAAGEPEITFWTKLETGDDVGWDAQRGGS